MVAYVAGGCRAATQLWIRSLDSLKARRIESADGAGPLFWSPDSKRLGFFAGDKLKVVSASGGRADTIADMTSGRGGTWSRAGVIVFAPNATGPLYNILPDGGRAEPATKLDSSRKEVGHRMPWFLPDGEHFLYAALPGKTGSTTCSWARLRRLEGAHRWVRCDARVCGCRDGCSTRGRAC